MPLNTPDFNNCDEKKCSTSSGVIFNCDDPCENGKEFNYSTGLCRDLEPCDCNCHDECPECKICVNGVCEDDPQCGERECIQASGAEAFCDFSRDELGRPNYTSCLLCTGSGANGQSGICEDTGLFELTPMETWRTNTGVELSGLAGSFDVVDYDLVNKTQTGCDQNFGNITFGSSWAERTREYNLCVRIEDIGNC